MVPSHRCHTRLLECGHANPWLVHSRKAIHEAVFDSNLARRSRALCRLRPGAGATFPAPIYAKWADAYHKANGARINYQSIGSGAGIQQIRARTVDFGASDMPLTDEALAKDGLVQFPTVIGGVVPVVNIA